MRVSYECQGRARVDVWCVGVGVCVPGGWAGGFVDVVDLAGGGVTVGSPA